MSESFADLFEESLKRSETRIGEVVTAEVVRIEHNFVVVNAGLKSEAYVPLSEFKSDKGELEVQVGEFVSVAIVAMENGYGDTIVSRDTAKRLASWMALEKSLESGEFVTGTTSGKVKGGLTVLVNGIRAFLPGSLVDTRPTKDLTPYENKTLEFKVIKLDRKRNNVVLSRRAVVEASMGEERAKLMSDPWEGVAVKYPVGAKFSGRVTNITDYGAFVELEPGVEGLVHVSEMSWTKKNVHPGKIVASSQEVEVLILDVDEPKRRISLGLKQAQGNPWEVFMDAHPPGSIVEGEIRNITEFGLFIGITADIDGMVHMSDLSWEQPGEAAMADFQKGQIVKAKVLDVDVEKERISLGIKQLASDPAAEVLDKVRKGDVVTCVVTKIESNGIEVKVDDVLTGFIRRAELARDRDAQRPDKFAVGEKVDAKVTAVDRAARRLALTIKGKEVEEEREQMKEYGSVDSGASLGDILGAAIRRRNQGSDE